MISYAEITKDVAQAAKFINDGRVVAFPTSTSYGLAVDTLQGYALQRLRNLKQRPKEKTFTVFMNDKLWPKFLKLSKQEKTFLKNLTNQPLTLLVQPKAALAHLAEDGLIGLRVIDHPLMQEIAETVNVPLTATSANKAGDTPCFTPACIEQTFPGRIKPPSLSADELKKIGDTTYDLSLACILDAGDLPKAPPTTIAKLVNGSPQIIRPGELTQEQLTAAVK